MGVPVTVLNQPMLMTSTKTSNVIRIREFSDSHLGHNKTPTSHVLKVFSNMLPNNDVTGLLDMIIIAGDLFDRDLQLYQDEVYEIKLWMAAFLKMVKERNIIVRVLEGTPRHDWKQSRWLIYLNDMLNIGANIKYFDTVDIEYIPELGIDVLYIPDEFKPTTLETQQIVRDLLNSKGKQTVDFTVMHGAFPHQLPKAAHARAQLHDPDFYLSITKYFIFVGHIHQYSQYQRILSAGSTDRYCHNDEKAKGMIEVTVRLNSDVHDIDFIENKQAAKFITVNAQGLDEDSVKHRIDKTIAKYGLKFNLRIEAKSNDSVYRIIDNYTNRYKDITWEFKRIEDKKPERITNVSELFKHVSLNKENIFDLLLQRVESQYPEYLETSKTLLETINNDPF